MKTTSAFLLATANLVAGHATFQSFVLGGKDQSQHFAVETPSNGNNPIMDVTSTAMICNGGTATANQVEVAAGSSITMQWHHNDPATAGDGDEPIAASHKGPVMVYIAPATGNGVGAVWTKIYADGYTNGKWGVDNFIAAKGQITVTLPDLAAGDYLLRPEIIALHNAESNGGAQFYNGCGQIKVTGSGSLSLPSPGTDMTKAYQATDPGVLVNIYNSLTSYQIPGPAVWDYKSAGGSSSPSQPATPASSATPAQSAQPAASSKPASKPSSPAPSATSATPSKPSSAPAAGYSATPSKPSSAPAPGYSATPPKYTEPASPTETATPSSGSSSGSTLPKTFTIEQFITWLKTQTGDYSRRARRHARSFEV